MSKPDDMSPAQRERLAKLAALPDDQIDTSDIPEAPSGAWEAAEVGRFFRPSKEVVTMPLDTDVLNFFRQAAEGSSYFDAINKVLRRHVERER